MRTTTTLRLQPAKLLRSKWTATVPVNKEKHFIVTALIEPETPAAPINSITIEAVISGRRVNLDWRDLQDPARWLQGWR